MLYLKVIYIKWDVTLVLLF